MVYVPKRVAERFARRLGDFQKILKMAKDKDVNESDTVTIVTDILADVFGFNKYTEITSEYSIRGTYCDLAIKVDDSVKFLIEVKAIGVDLKPPHLRQALNYGAQEGIPWVILTNGINWQINRIRFEQPVDYDSICALDLLAANPRAEEEMELLFLLCREAISTTALEDFRDRIQYVNRFVIGMVLQEQPAVELVRRELRKLSPNLKVDVDEIRNILRTEVIKREVIEGELADAAKDRAKNAAKKMAKKQKNGAPEKGPDPVVSEAQSQPPAGQ